MSPFIRNLFAGKVSAKTFMTGTVRRPQEKNLNFLKLIKYKKNKLKEDNDKGMHETCFMHFCTYS